MAVSNTYLASAAAGAPMLTPSEAMMFLVCILLGLGLLYLLYFWKRETARKPELERVFDHPILSPIPGSWWESEAVFNPAAFVADGRVHLLYRAMGPDGVSRVGYASSADGVNFDRLPEPVYAPDNKFQVPRADALEKKRKLSYDTQIYPSGGGWGGVEDPRAIVIDERVLMSFVAFDGWGFIRMACTSLPLEHLRNQIWAWKSASLLSPPGQIHKNWVIFPEKINGKYAIIHSIAPKVYIEYVDSIDEFEDENKFIHSHFTEKGHNNGRENFWDNRVRGAGPPPVRVPEGWLLFYHAMDKRDPNRYKIGVMLLDANDPTKVLYRSRNPLLAPDMHYENDWKPGVVYTCGAVVFGDDLFVYYGGGDKYLAVAKANVRELVRRLTHSEHMELERVTI